MKFPVFLCALFFAGQSFFAQPANQLNGNDIFIAADSLVETDFSGVIVIDTHYGGKKTFVGGMMNK